MIAFDVATERPLPRLVLVMTRSEALELIEKVAYLLRDPSYHHDHIETSEGTVDVVVAGSSPIESYWQPLREHVEGMVKREALDQSPKN